MPVKALDLFQAFRSFKLTFDYPMSGLEDLASIYQAFGEQARDDEIADDLKQFGPTRE